MDGFWSNFLWLGGVNFLRIQTWHVSIVVFFAWKLCQQTQSRGFFAQEKLTFEKAQITQDVARKAWEKDMGILLRFFFWDIGQYFWGFGPVSL